MSLRLQEALHIAARHGSVRRSDLTSRFSVSGKTARQDLVALIQAGLLRRLGARRGRTVCANADDLTDPRPVCSRAQQGVRQGSKKT